MTVIVKVNLVNLTPSPFAVLSCQADVLSNIHRHKNCLHSLLDKLLIISGRMNECDNVKRGRQVIFTRSQDSHLHHHTRTEDDF